MSNMEKSNASANTEMVESNENVDTELSNKVSTGVERNDTYEREEDILEIILKVYSCIDLNKMLNYPILSVLIVKKVLDKCGLEPRTFTGYMEKPDAPRILIPYPWVETFLNGVRHVTDITSFEDKSKSIIILGRCIRFGDNCKTCNYFKKPPPEYKIVGVDIGKELSSEGKPIVPTFSDIRSALNHPDKYIEMCPPRVQEVYHDIVTKAILNIK